MHNFSIFWANSDILQEYGREMAIGKKIRRIIAKSEKLNFY